MINNSNSTEINDFILSMSKEMSSLTSTQKHTSENVDKLSKSMDNLVSGMNKFFVKGKEFEVLVADVKELKSEVAKIKTSDKMQEYRSDRLEKVVYGAVGIILIAVITGVVSTVVSHG